MNPHATAMGAVTENATRAGRCDTLPVFVPSTFYHSTGGVICGAVHIAPQTTKGAWAKAQAPLVRPYFAHCPRALSSEDYGRVDCQAAPVGAVAKVTQPPELAPY